MLCLNTWENCRILPKQIWFRDFVSKILGEMVLLSVVCSYSPMYWELFFFTSCLKRGFHRPISFWWWELRCVLPSSGDGNCAVYSHHLVMGTALCSPSSGDGNGAVYSHHLVMRTALCSPSSGDGNDAVFSIIRWWELRCVLPSFVEGTALCTPIIWWWELRCVLPSFGDGNCAVYSHRSVLGTALFTPIIWWWKLAVYLHYSVMGTALCTPIIRWWELSCELLSSGDGNCSVYPHHSSITFLGVPTEVDNRICWLICCCYEGLWQIICDVPL